MQSDALLDTFLMGSLKSAIKKHAKSAKNKDGGSVDDVGEDEVDLEEASDEAEEDEEEDDEEEEEEPAPAPPPAKRQRPSRKK